MAAPLLDRLMSLVVPPLCVACREPELGGGALCSDCVDGLVRLGPGQAAHRSPALTRAWAPFSYEGVARRLVMALKARSATQAARFMATAIEARAPTGLLDAGVLVPVPGQPAGNRRRGFDHAHEIAGALAALTGLEVVGALHRAPVRPQVGLARLERQANARGSVSVRAGVPPGGRAILVDDVYTTGATLDACALALRGAGAGEVVAVCFARTQTIAPWRTPSLARSMWPTTVQRSDPGRSSVRIEIRGHQTAITDTIRQHVEDRFTARIGKQVSDLASLRVDLLEEHREQVAEATLQLKGVTLRAREGSNDLMHSVDLVADKLARQVKRHRDKRRGRRDPSSRAATPPPESA